MKSQKRTIKFQLKATSEERARDRDSLGISLSVNLVILLKSIVHVYRFLQTYVVVETYYTQLTTPSIRDIPICCRTKHAHIYDISAPLPRKKRNGKNIVYVLRIHLKAQSPS